MKLKAEITWAWIFEALGDYRAADEMNCELVHRFDRYFTDWQHAQCWNDRARVAIRRKDRFLARRYAREACQLFAKAQARPEILAVQKMIAGGPLAYL